MCDRAQDEKGLPSIIQFDNTAGPFAQASFTKYIRTVQFAGDLHHSRISTILSNSFFILSAHILHSILRLRLLQRRVKMLSIPHLCQYVYYSVI